ncbi:hypothetical protein LJC08_06430 [Methanimicrococcus sp. OttesenSCG-928-J09]|nr:hypothetical protein [Methanimicrococcus sp. OttesenSCG-928-J09]
MLIICTCRTQNYDSGGVCCRLESVFSLQWEGGFSFALGVRFPFCSGRAVCI